MKTITTIQEMKDIIPKNKTIGFVPTMGYLHEAHLSLIKKSKQENDITILSIYVNPTQFNNKEDLKKYPRNIKADKELAEKEGVDYIFYPDNNEIYPEGMKYLEYKNKYMKKLCAESRPLHFEGVVTIVKKLFDIIKPTSTYFGQKDFQQALIIKQMIKDYNYKIKFNICPTIREEDGLAMSSRNAMLTKEQRKEAVIIYKSLLKAKELIKKGEKNTEKIKNKIKENIETVKEAKVDYIEIRNSQNLKETQDINNSVIAIAVYFDIVRLIDNILIKEN